MCFWTHKPRAVGICFSSLLKTSMKMKSGLSSFFGMNWALGTALTWNNKAYDVCYYYYYFLFRMRVKYFSFFLLSSCQKWWGTSQPRAKTNERWREWRQVHSKTVCFVLCTERWTHTQGANQYQNSEYTKKRTNFDGNMVGDFEFVLLYMFYYICCCQLERRSLIEFAFV